MGKRNPMTDRVLDAIGTDTKTSSEIAQDRDNERTKDHDTQHARRKTHQAQAAQQVVRA